MPPPPQVVEWLRKAYQRPQVDPEWLDACYEWVVDDLGLDPSTQMDEIIRNVDEQLLQSKLDDSMLQGTGLPANVSNLDNACLPGPPVLVEILSIMEIGHSAFSLQNTRQNRIEKADLTGLGGGGNDDGEGDGNGAHAPPPENEGPIPSYPRSMLKFELTDGSVKITAVEYRSIPEIQLGETPLGYKMLLKGVFFRRGIAFLEPKNIELKGFRTEDREVNQDAEFLRALRIRMGKPPENPEQPVDEDQPPTVADPFSAPPSSCTSKYFDHSAPNLAQLPSGHATLVNERFLSPPRTSGVGAAEADNDSFEVGQQLLLDEFDEAYGMEIDPEILEEIEIAERSAMQDKPMCIESATGSGSSTVTSMTSATASSNKIGAPQEIIAVDDDDDLYCSYDEADFFDDFENVMANDKQGRPPEREIISISDSE